jgi:cob(I)alamin adenosyltransferase
MGYVYLFTGDGGGKTTNALGLALRAVAHKRKVFLAQLLKWENNTGEFIIQEMKEFAEYYMVQQYGRYGWHGLDNLTEQDKLNSKQAIVDAWYNIKYGDCKLIIFDEINLAVYCDLIEIDYIKQFIQTVKSLYPNVDIVMTGRNAPQKLMDLADFVIEIKPLKIPTEQVCTEGVQY